MFLLHLNVLETKKLLQLGTENSRREWQVIPAQEVKETQDQDQDQDLVASSMAFPMEFPGVLRRFQVP